MGAPNLVWWEPLPLAAEKKTLTSFKKLPQGHEDYEYVLSFEFWQREGGSYSEQTDTHPVLYSNIDWAYLLIFIISAKFEIIIIYFYFYNWFNDIEPSCSF